MSSEAERSAPDPVVAPADRARAFEQALSSAGLGLRVEAAGALAVVAPLGGAWLDWTAVREQVVRLAREHGFSHVAADLSDSGPGEHAPAVGAD